MKYLPPLLAVLAAASPFIPALAASAQDAAHPFVSVQPDLFGEAGSLSNAWADFDNDGDLDFAVSLKSGAIRLYRNDGGQFTSVGEALGLPASGPEFRGLSWGDYDGDGWLDLLAGATMPDSLTALFHNNGGKGFTNVAAEAGLTVPGRSSRQNNWVDLDGDGDLDLYATDRIGKNRLYRNDGGRFAQILADAPPTLFRSTVGACWFDYDEDGDLDLYLANQSGKADALLRNDGGAFTDAAPALGMDQPVRDKTEGGVGCAVGDYDNDGHLDIFVPNYGHNVLWHNDGNGRFTNTAPALGLAVENHAVGASWGDYDNDGRLDLFVTSYHGPRGEQVPADALFHNEGKKGFVNVIAANPLVNNGDHGVEWVDFDGDGAIDLNMTHGYSAVGGHFLFRNAMAPGDAHRSLHVLVRGADGRQAPPGTEIRLYDKKGRILATRLVSTGGGYGAQSVTPVHFGLATMKPVTVEVTWITGTGRISQRFPNVDPREWADRSFVVTRTPG
ncbi:CRTAC1 family protein [Novosphingobium beihaiensis]|uniref:CRTAC1 family protein n=1 Tax=Novosphingobium beihaiensis TaxID=2930389 RepID=A0ABT0BL22_9SPHN|nr:CRTAC1 family protein [Novosphingobium beihaiensis]MCJ2185750.1 CRTAC1 family protein [Novosphingobium beihaiensis]